VCSRSDPALRLGQHIYRARSFTLQVREPRGRLLLLESSRHFGGEVASSINPKHDSAKIRLTLSPQAEKYARRDAPVEARRMAALGTLPLEPHELATVLFFLLHDPDTEVKTLATASLEGLPESIAYAAITADTHPAVLSHFAHIHRESEAHCEKIALNPRTDDATLMFLASLPLRRVIEIISNNQERLLRSEDIVEALGANPLTGRAVIERILTFLGVGDSDQDADDDMQDVADIGRDAAEAAVRALLGDDMAEVARQLASEDASEDEETSKNLFAAVQKMSVMQKIKLARIGGKEARSLLIRDRNKIVSTSVIQSPKITETEIVSISKSRNISDEILRMISLNREWTKSNQIRFALATNPKCPQPVAIKFLNYLQERELRSIMKSKDVPSAISAHARRILTKKGKV
jgi:hypothetical protein